MTVLLHPTINWQGWQQIRQSSVFLQLSSGDRIKLINQLPHSLWAWEMGENTEIERLLESLGRGLQEKD